MAITGSGLSCPFVGLCLVLCSILIIIDHYLIRKERSLLSINAWLLMQRHETKQYTKKQKIMIQRISSEQVHTNGDRDLVATTRHADISNVFRAQKKIRDLAGMRTKRQNSKYSHTLTMAVESR